jgi:hypothetical protein
MELTETTPEAEKEKKLTKNNFQTLQPIQTN